MSAKGIYQYHIIQRDADFTGACTHTSLMNHILQAAGDDADLNGFGISDLNLGNCSWVLSRMCCEFGRRPRQGEAINVRTWVNDVGRLMTTRNMEVLDDAGELIARTVTQWAVIDIDRRHAVDIRENVDYDGCVSDEPPPIATPARIPRLDVPEVASKKVAYSDIDFNSHMNAMKYIEWMIDNLPVDDVVRGALTRIDINFLKEATLGQHLTLHGSDDNNVRRYEIRESTTAEPLCRCAFTFG